MAIDSAQMERYRATFSRRRAAAAAEGELRRQRAWRVARAAAEVLRDHFAAERVVIFGSLVDSDGSHFGEDSDIDLAAWGLDGDDYFLAVARMQDLSPEFSVDLVDMTRCPKSLGRNVETHGVVV